MKQLSNGDLILKVQVKLYSRAVRMSVMHDGGCKALHKCMQIKMSN